MSEKSELKKFMEEMMPETENMGKFLTQIQQISFFCMRSMYGCPEDHLTHVVLLCSLLKEEKDFIKKLQEASIPSEIFDLAKNHFSKTNVERRSTQSPSRGK